MYIECHHLMIPDNPLTSLSTVTHLLFSTGSQLNSREFNSMDVSGWRRHTEASATETSVRIGAFGIGGRNTHKHTCPQRFSPRVMEKDHYFVLQWLGARASAILACTHFLLFYSTLAVSHIHFVPTGGGSSYTTPITTPGWASQVSISTSVP